MELSHLDEKGNARMVDVSSKNETKRTAVASGRVKMQPHTLELITSGGLPKGDCIGTARIAGIMAVKETSRLIPMCHGILIEAAGIEFAADEEQSCIHITATVTCSGKTGVEMEALTAASVAALTIYDMCKAVDKYMVIEDIKLLKKTGGKSGTFLREQRG